MAKPRSAVKDYLHYFVVRFLICFLQSLSLEMGRTVASFLAWLTHRLDRRHREIALDNLRQAFPGRYTDARLDIIVQGVFRHFFMVLVEIAQIPRKLRPS